MCDATKDDENIIDRERLLEIRDRAFFRLKMMYSPKGPTKVSVSTFCL